MDLTRLRYGIFRNNVNKWFQFRDLATSWANPFSDLLKVMSMAKQESGRKQMPKINDSSRKPNNKRPVITSLVDASIDKPWILNLSERAYLDQITGRCVPIAKQYYAL